MKVFGVSTTLSIHTGVLLAIQLPSLDSRARATSDCVCVSKGQLHPHPELYLELIAS